MEPFGGGMRNPDIRGLRPVRRGLKTNTVEQAGSYWAVATSFSIARLGYGWDRGLSRAPVSAEGAEAGRPPPCRSVTKGRRREGMTHPRLTARSWESVERRQRPAQVRRGEVGERGVSVGRAFAGMASALTDPR